MGAYIHKAKVDDFMGGKLGLYDFWYKPYNSLYEAPRWQTRFETAGDRFIHMHPEGVQYVGFAPTSHNHWNKTQKIVVYKVPEGRGLPVVINDYSNAYENAFDIKNAIGVVWGAKYGKKHFLGDLEEVDRALYPEKYEVNDIFEEAF